MRSDKAFTIFAAAAASTALSQSPPGFSPPIEEPLSVDYAGIKVNPAGLNVPAQAVNNTPMLDLPENLKGTFLSVLMDFTVQLPGMSTNQTLIHWIQPGFSGMTHPFRTQAEAVVPYFPPGPPPDQTHTYGVFLYAQPEESFSIPPDFQAYFQNLTTSVNNRIGFDLGKFALSSHLGEPLAANFFFVSTPNNASTATTSATPGLASSTGQMSPMPRATGGGNIFNVAGIALLGAAVTLVFGAL